MKYALVGLIICGGIAAYFKFKPEVTPVTPAPAPVVVVATPAAKPLAIAKPTPEATPSFLAPNGVYFLLAPTNVTGDDGIVGIRAGTQLKKTGADEYTTSNGLHLKLAANQVTNDLRVQAQLVQNDIVAQNALAKRQYDQSVAAAEMQKRAAAAAPATPAARPAVAAAPAAPAAGNGLERQAYGETSVRRNVATRPH